jgi:hypothetical protein
MKGDAGSMTSKMLQVLPLILSAAALILCIVALADRSAPSTALATASGAEDRQIRELSDRLAELRAKLERVGSDPRGVSDRQPVRESAREQETATAELQKRVAALEAAVAALRRPPDSRQLAAQPAPAEDLTAAQRKILDPRASDRDKIAALKALRGRRIDGQDALSHDVVVALLGVLDHAEDADTRTDVIRNLHGVNDPALRDSMLRSLTSDPSPQVRGKAAEDINTFLPDVAVEAALRSAADFDSDDGVRASALNTLAHKKH